MKTDGQQAYQASDYRRALYCLEKALEISTHSLLLKTSRAECLAFLGRYTEVDITIQYKISTYTYLRSSVQPNAICARHLRGRTLCCR